eukprot:1508615-Prymnesium_polylepis.1
MYARRVTRRPLTPRVAAAACSDKAVKRSAANAPPYRLRPRRSARHVALRASHRPYLGVDSGQMCAPPAHSDLLSSHTSNDLQRNSADLLRRRQPS